MPGNRVVCKRCIGREAAKDYEGYDGLLARCYLDIFDTFDTFDAFTPFGESCEDFELNEVFT